ncbi:MAG TPA: IS1634 family transposase, partial [Actinoplanes sp.]|nr:IS1634 family transposase [Actinoplanes sp.]
MQIVTRRGGQIERIEHLGSAHSDAELALLVAAAREQLAGGQEALDLGALSVRPVRMGDTADWTRPVSSGADAAGADDDGLVPAAVAVPAAGGAGAGGRPLVDAGARVVATSSLVLWQVLVETYARLGFDVLGDEAFKAMVLARIVEPTSKADSLRVLAEIGAPTPSLSSLFRSLKRCKDTGREAGQDTGDATAGPQQTYRGRLARACAARSAAAGGLNALVMYDCTTLHFEVTDEDPGPEGLRKVGMSKEHRVDPQVQVGLLVDPSGFPLEVHLFEGNTAETTTLLPVLNTFQQRHGITGLVVVADAGMLSAGNLNAIEDAGFSFIVGSRITKAPYDLAEHFTRHGDYFTDGQILESTRAMGAGRHERTRRIVYQYRFKRAQRDNRVINAQIAKAERIAGGKAPVARTRFLKVTGATKELNQATIDRARQLAGLKG